ncbi:uncharacterized protein B0H18DRAFT_74210 [Fomitopsis serialis]|uniref:uncharacterized protein n=1 Tax=Fomitopsis serialis TaxID=139415 RepID=UPI00200890C1|nr:uncharacterized protein B0H18DRAFT_74210 [Neoantrodia serialis]KAH9916342.1 hypothetical protein B0H18DRAFT_74210 [Neoantrodia serialis]
MEVWRQVALPPYELFTGHNEMVTQSGYVTCGGGKSIGREDETATLPRRKDHSFHRVRRVFAIQKRSTARPSSSGMSFTPLRLDRNGLTGKECRSSPRVARREHACVRGT